MPSDHYFDRTPTAPSQRRRVRLTLPDLTVDLVTDRAVFSRDQVDPGTKLLLLEAPPPPPPARHVLDLGCGYGPIAVTVARRSPASTIWAVDVNERALALCRENAEAAGAGNVRCVPPEEVPDDVTFDAVYANPPVRIGKAALHDLLRRWLGRLSLPDGRAWLVVHKHLGADSLARHLADEGHAVVRRRSRQGYRVLEVAPATTAAGGA